MKPQSRTTFALLAELCERDPDHEVLVDGDRRWTYAGLLADVKRFAGALLARGISAGDRIGILAGNRAEWVIAHFGITAIGGISVGLNTWASASELAYQLEHSGMRLLVFEAMFRDRNFVDLVEDARGITGGLPGLKTLVLDGPGSESGQWRTFLADSTQCSDAALEHALAGVSDTAIASLLYTSGSTALPKGVPLLHGGLVANMWEIGERQKLGAEDRLWLAVSLFWSLGSVNALFAVLTHRGCIVLQHHFDAGEALTLIERERCTVFYGTPNMALALAEHPSLETTDLSSLRTGVTIGTPAQVRRVAELGVAEICNVYGLTEAYGNSTVTDADLPLAQRVGCVGSVLPGQEIRIVDPQTLQPCATGVTGEITLRGNVTPGYWENPEQTAAAFTAQGWFRTGDYGYVDERGFLYYRGRLKEMLKSGGINVAPAEVEHVLGDHPAVELAFVTGVPDERLDEAVAAVIVLRRGHAASDGTLREHCRERLAAYKVPRHFRFVTAGELPLTTTGKLQRNRLPELFVS